MSGWRGPGYCTGLRMEEPACNRPPERGSGFCPECLRTAIQEKLDAKVLRGELLLAGTGAGGSALYRKL